jgi:phage tail-like protein
MPTTSQRDRSAPYFGGRFVMEFDDKKAVGFVTSIDGGHFKADPIASMVGDSFTVTKYPGKPKYEDITVTVGMAMAPAFWKWVKASLDNKPERRNGALVGYDFNNCERSRRTFKNALISEIGFPALDGSSKNQGLLTIKFSPEGFEFAKGDGSALKPAQANNEVTKQKMWLTSNFRVNLEKFKNDDSLRKAKVEAFAVKQNIITNNVGPELESRKEIGRLELPLIQVSFAESDAEHWMDWYKKSVVGGVPDETTGAITFLASNQKDELMRLELDGVGLTSLEVEKYEAMKEGIARVKATLYVTGLKLVSGSGTA